MKTSKTEKVHGGVQELSLLFEISRILDSGVDLKDVLGPVLRAMAEHMGMMRGTITLLNRKTVELQIEAAYGLSPAQQERGRYKPGEGVTGKVVQTGAPAVVPRISEEPLFLNRTGARRKLKKKDVSFICVPIKLEKETIGALSADRLFDEPVSFKEDERLLTIIASMIAQAVKLRRSVQEDRQSLLDENARLHAELKERFKPSNIVGNSKPMQAVYELIAKVCKSDTTVLIRGETGTGKELVAHAVHYNSPRASGPFIVVNCAALPENLIDSELFGHERGAFTGAVAERKGRFETVDGGTIFLDEVGDLPLATQVKLLRVLQEGAFERLGGNVPIKVNIRVLAATNRDLEELVKQEKFREDLYYRLNVFPVLLPPLRERKEDILLLADHFVEKYGKAMDKPLRRISTPAIDMLMSYHWPGNVRELENSLERAVVLSDDGVIHSYHLPPTLQTAEASGTIHVGSLQSALDKVEYEMIVDALKSFNGNMAKAAKNLGITERMIGLRLKKHHIDAKQYRAVK
jgi:Nif-specific regulatory protein